MKEKFSKAWDTIKEKKQLVAVILYCIALLVAILIGFLAMGQPVVAVCIAMILEAAIAVLMHNAEVWIHAIVLIIEIIAGILIARVPLMILCAVVYVLTLVALRVIYTGKE